MFKKRQLRFSNLGLVTVGFSLLFFVLFISQLSCGEGKPKTNDKSKKNIPPGTANSITPILSGNVPSEVNLPNPDTLTDEGNRPFFDQFSWQSFIALCWPVTPGQRGQPLNPNDPNTFLNMTDSTPVVWTSYKNQWDLFNQGNQTPSPWNSWTDPEDSCQVGHHFFGSAKGQVVAEPDESFSVPLIDQNRNYALFEIRYNELQYNFIVNNGLYLNKNLYNYQKKNGGAVTMPTSTATTQGSILVKASWKSLTSEDDWSRYYVLNEMVYDPVSKQCIKQPMGLVGLHIAQKIDSFPQWIWSSFEQVDNVPGAPNAKTPFSFNNGTQKPVTTGGYANQPDSTGLNPNKSSRVPVQVTRLNEIPSTPVGLSTVDINKIYQAAVGNTWMKYYQLVITQWPTNPQQFKQSSKGGTYPKDCGQPFPVNNCVNITMETYFQSQGDAAGAGGNSCMSCHYTANNTDFSWSLLLRSHDRKPN